MAIKLGMNGKLYRNTGTYGVPVWTEITNVKDLTLNLEKGEADVTTRANEGWRANQPTLKEASIEFDMVWDTDDDGFSAIQDAFFNDTTVEVAVMDGDITDGTTEGLRATVGVSTFSRGEPLEEAMTVSVTLKPTYSAHAPEWITGDSGILQLSFTMTLDGGAATLDLTAIPYGAGTYDATGKIVIGMQVTNNGANDLVFIEGAANGYAPFTFTNNWFVSPGGVLRYADDGGPTIAAGVKTIDLTGTGAQTSTWTLTLEDAS